MPVGNVLHLHEQLPASPPPKSELPSKGQRPTDVEAFSYCCNVSHILLKIAECQTI